MSSRSRGRQFALQMLFQREFTNQSISAIDEHFWHETATDDVTRQFCLDLARGVLQHRQSLHLEISAYLRNWSLERIARIDRIILEIALYELLHGKGTPWKVVIDEAVVLSKMFSTDKSPNFINGVLHSWSVANGFRAEPRKDGGEKPTKENEAPHDTAETEDDQQSLSAIQPTEEPS